MKKLLLLLTCLVGSNSWSACTYNFDATQAQLDTLSQNAPNFNFFPIINGQKFGFNLLSGLPTGSKGYYRLHLAASKMTIENAIKEQQPQNQSPITNFGDKQLPASGIIAYEFNFKVLDNLTANSQLAFFPVTVSGDLENGKYGFIFSYSNSQTTEGKNSNGFSAIFSTNDQSKQKMMELFNVTAPAQLQKIGVYINQNSNQVGVIANGQNLGYIYTLPSKAKNIAFSFISIYKDIQPADLNKEVSIELVTDKSKFTNAFPTGTTDICGN